MYVIHVIMFLIAIILPYMKERKKEKKGNHVMFGCKLKISIKLLNGGNSDEQFT